MALTRKLSLIQGPPGTGKTRTACHLINIAVRLNERRDAGKVLAVAFSNVAADNLLEGESMSQEECLNSRKRI